MLKLVQVGTGRFSRYVHGPVLKRYAEDHPGEVELAAVCVRQNVERAEEYCREFGFSRVYTDLDEMLETEMPDVAWVMTSITATRSVVGKIMEYGVPVLFEKPHGRDMVEARELVDVATQTGCPNMVAFNRRFAVTTAKALKWIDDMGPIERVHVSYLRSGRDDERFAFDTGIHAFDCVHMLGDRYLDGLRTAKTLRVKSIAGPYNFHTELAFGSGATGCVDLMANSGLSEELYTVFGQNTCVKFATPWFGTAGKVELWKNNELVDSHTWPTTDVVYNLGVYQETEAFLGAVDRGLPLWPSAEQTLSSIDLAESVQEGLYWSG